MGMQLKPTRVVKRTVSSKAFVRSAKAHECLDYTAIIVNRLRNGGVGVWHAHHERGHSVSYYDLCKQLTEVRHHDEEYGALSLQVERGALLWVKAASENYWRRLKEWTQSGCVGKKPETPRYKSWRKAKTIPVASVSSSMLERDNQGRIVGVSIKGLPRLDVRFSLSKSEGVAKTMVITKKPSGWFVRIVMEVEVETLPENDNQVGIDWGIAKRLTLSNNTMIEHRERDFAGIARIQRAIARSTKGSNRYRKRVAQLGRMLYREATSNLQECHRISTWVIKTFGHIGVEDLSIKNMSKSAKGTVEKPGKQVAQKRGLNRSIQTQTWGKIKEQLVYKAEWYGRKVVLVDPKHTSQLCYACGVIEPSNRKNQRYKCECEYTNDADVNAALNILARSGGTCVNAPDKNLTGELSPVFL